jgi:hypothetical protein
MPPRVTSAVNLAAKAARTTPLQGALLTKVACCARSRRIGTPR